MYQLCYKSTAVEEIFVLRAQAKGLKPLWIAMWQNVVWDVSLCTPIQCPVLHEPC